MKKIVLLCGKGDSSTIVYNALIREFRIERVIMEQPVPYKIFLRKRIKKLGLLKVLGQIAFMLLVNPILQKKSAMRKKEILEEYSCSIDDSALLSSKPFYVDSVNSDECIKELQNICPDIVIVNGTRIISEQVLSCVNASFLNMHAGITPKYRGCHGAYWALYHNDKENAGVTVHLVDKGIDTGDVIYQSKIPLTVKDNFATYPLLQTCVGIRDEIAAIHDLMNGDVVCQKNLLPSGLYTHPTIFQYLWKRIFCKIK